MDNMRLVHHGILGQKWGVRRFQNKDGTRTSAGKQRERNRINEAVSEKKTLTDDELRQKITRLELELEKRNKELSRADEQKKVSKGKAFVMDVLQKSGSNIATQLMTYAMGTLVNKLAGDEIVNPKKGQKDK